MAAAFGVINGHLAFAWRSGSSVEQAREAAMARCSELRASGCNTVMVDGELRKAALLDVAAGLGALSVPDVRSGFMRSVNAALERAAPQAVAPKPAPAPPPVAERPSASPPEPPRQASVPAPPSPPAAPTPAKEWADAMAALRAGNGRGSLAGSLTVLSAAQRSDEREAFAKFEQGLQRLPWKSALAMGERGGWVHYGWSSREQRTDWAADAAVQACKRAGGVNCVVVMADGKFNDAAFLRFAEQLGSRPQAVVRDSLARSMGKQF
jgi:hypothetical protein